MYCRVTVTHLRHVPHLFLSGRSKKVSLCRECKAGAGVEATPGECDTPGFALCEEPKIEIDSRNTKRLYMPRNHARLNQTSGDLLQCWRGNCDIQVLLYDHDMKQPSAQDIARVTDYVVAYATKGNKPLREEREQNKLLINK